MVVRYSRSRQASPQAKRSQSAVDNPLVETARASVREVFKDMFGLDAAPGAVRVGGQSPTHGWDISGLVGLAGQAQGIIAVRMPSALAAAMLERSGVEPGDERERREMTGHLVAEFTNIVAGHASSAIQGHEVDISPPVVVRGPNHQIAWPDIAPVNVLPFSTPSGDFEIVVCLKL